jgi:predicted small secreted protein
MKSKTEEKLLSVKLLGGMQETRFALGIPRQKTVPLTTFDDALSITKDLAKLTDGSLDIQLLGFGDSGMDNGKIAGGFSLSPVFGNAKELIEYGQQQKIPLYFDYDIIRYNSRGNGFGKRQAAKNATSLVSVQKNYYPSIRSVNTEIPEYWLLGRSYLSSAATKLLSKTKNMTGISLASLGSISYSDYNEQKYPLRKGADTDAVSIINELRSKGKLVLVSSANDYAAASADRILDAPVTSDQSDSLDRDIPFYQMVFKGYVPISNTPLNAAARPESDFLKAIETGSGLCFSLYNIPRADVTRSDTLNRLLYSSLYGDNKEKMQKVVERAGAYFENVSGARISDHAYITDNVTRTVFDNGVTVYVNYGEKAFDTQAGTVQPLDFVYTKG